MCFGQDHLDVAIFTSAGLTNTSMISPRWPRLARTWCRFPLSLAGWFFCESRGSRSCSQFLAQASWCSQTCSFNNKWRPGKYSADASFTGARKAPSFRSSRALWKETPGGKQSPIHKANNDGTARLRTWLVHEVWYARASFLLSKPADMLEMIKWRRRDS